jgi:hypothetical protein
MNEGADASSTAIAGRPNGRRRLGRLALLALVAALIVLGSWHATKPLPAGLRLAAQWTAVPAGDVRLLVDVTTADAYGQPIVQQEIFDEMLRVIRDARRFVVLDQFLFNAHRGALARAAAPAAPSGRSLSAELRDELIAARHAQPQLRVLLITDPINDVYGGMPSGDLEALRAAGVDVVVTDLDRLRDPNPLYSSLWRLAIRWWSGDGGGEGWLPNPLAVGPSRVTFRAWARLLNMKANHRKVVIADDGQAGLVGLVGSMNPHDASSAHSNLALQVRGAALEPLLASELDVARFSGWRGEWPALPAAPSTADAPATANAGGDPAADTAAFAHGGPVRVRALTEGAIADAVLERLAQAGSGTRIDVAMFYLSDRRVIAALLEAAARGAQLRLLLDPNKDAFGREKTGIPNRPVASELAARSDGAIRLRWYRTHGEQFHVKLLAVRDPDRIWFTTGSANLTRRNVGDFNLEANLAVEAAPGTDVALTVERWFETLWNNRGPAGVEYTTDFGTFADPAQSSYWAYRLMEWTGLSSF